MTMRLCIPTADDSGLQARIYPHFGSAPCFTLVDTETQESETIANDKTTHAHGSCQPLRTLLGRPFDALVVCGIGRGAVENLRDHGIGVYRSGDARVGEILVSAREGTLSVVDDETLCRGHARSGGSQQSRGGGCSH
jgi:predicted Fe-Mo cluster-binding NifX family protein